ncbi:glycosyltransferase [Oceanihabitans sediminis]|uniref:glycosyltransferase n=1 Tax=Oceanihabitans sediminis TaxID=1812012 RepID=UPI003A931CE6
MKVLYFWERSYSALSDIDKYFSMIEYRTEADFRNASEFMSYLRANAIDLVILHNPYLSEHRKALYFALKKEKNIKYLVSDRGALPNSWFFDPNGFNADSSSYARERWDLPLSEERDKRVAEYISREVNGNSALELQGGRIGKEKLREKLNIDPYKKVIFAPLQRPSDTVIKYFSGSVSNLNDFISKLEEVQDALSDDWIVILKKHPLEIRRTQSTKIRYAPDDVHFKDLIELSNAVVLINSGVGVTAMMAQKPVLSFGATFYGHEGLSFPVTSSGDVVEILSKGECQPDFEKVKRFISYLREDFYSFGKFETETRMNQKYNKVSITNKITFETLNGLPKKGERKTLIVTDIKFWERNVGNKVKIYNLIKFLEKEISITILFLGELTKHDVALITEFGLGSSVLSIEDLSYGPETLDETENYNIDAFKQYYNEKYKKIFNKYIEKNIFHNIIIEYIRLDYLVSGLETEANIIVDTHDLFSSRTLSYRENNDKNYIEIDLEDEIKILDNYDTVISIQRNEHSILTKNLSNARSILVQHYCPTMNSFRENNGIVHVGFVGSAANIPHLKWFLENIWCYFEHERLMCLDIYGLICKSKAIQKFRKSPNVKFCGTVSDVGHIYRNIDVAINPILYGSGLKIKNVEALAHGIPLITTNEGANGIEDGVNEAFLLANSKDEWLEALILTTRSLTARKILSKRALTYAEVNFGKSVFEPLLDALEGR